MQLKFWTHKPCVCMRVWGSVCMWLCSEAMVAKDVKPLQASFRSFHRLQLSQKQRHCSDCSRLEKRCLMHQLSLPHTLLENRAWWPRSDRPRNFGHPNFQYVFSATFATDYFHSIVSLYLVLFYITWWFGWPPTIDSNQASTSLDSSWYASLARTISLDIVLHTPHLQRANKTLQIFTRFPKGQVWREFLLVRAAEKFEPLAWGSVCERARGMLNEVLRVIWSHRSIQWVDWR